MRVAARALCVWCGLALAFAFVGGTTHPGADAAGMAMKLTAQLTGSEEAPPVETKGKGSFQGTVPSNNKSISYRLTYSGLTSRATVAHIHVGPKGVAGGVTVFLCGGGGKPACPASGGTVSGSITAASVLATGDLKKGDLPGLMQAIMNGNTYANVHTTKNKGGEIRGQIESGK